MKVNSLDFPYPILCANDDVAGSYKIDGPYVGRDFEKIKLTLTHILRNHDIQAYIDKGSAEYMVEIFCAKTFFRKAYFSSKADQVIEIKENLLRDQVKVEFYLVATSEINDYLPKTAHSDYHGYKFSLKKGDLLAYGGNTQFDAPKQWLSGDAVGSFMQIIPGDFKNGPMTINLLHPSGKISIALSTTDYDEYQALQAQKRFDDIFHSAIVLPALIFAISQFVDAPPDQYDGIAWASVMKDRKQNDPRVNKLAWTVEEAPRIAQAMLDNPFSRTLKAITNIALEING